MNAVRAGLRSALKIWLLPLVLSVGSSPTIAVDALWSEADDEPRGARSNPPQTSSAPAGDNAPTASPPAGSPTPSPRGSTLTTAQIVAKWEPSVALVKGRVSKGTGFLVKPGIVATNAHVIGEEFVSALEVRFPSASAGQQGPLTAELLYEDPRRDLAFLRVSTSLPAIEVAPSYTFVKGEDLTVIGNPSIGEEVVLENAVSRGVMSAKTVIEGRNYFQISMAINPGNSGGPVFDSSGRAIGVVTLKSNRAEAMAFCIPAEDLRAAMALVEPPQPGVAARHRAQAAFRLLTVAGGLYGVALDIRASILRRTASGPVQPHLLPNESIQQLDKLLKTLDQRLFSLIEEEVARIRDDDGLATAARDRLRELSADQRAMKHLYDHPTRPASLYAARVRELRADYLRHIEVLQKDLELEVPAQLLALLKLNVHGARPPAAIAQVVPSPLRSRSPGEPRPQPRVATAPAYESGVELFRRGEYREAYAVFRNLLQSQPDDARVWYFAALSYGLASGDWGRITQSMAEAGVAREQANQPPRSEIDAAFAVLTRETGKEWLDSYRSRAR